MNYYSKVIIWLDIGELDMSNLTKPLGNYSHYRTVGNLVFLAGQGSRDIATNKVAGLTHDQDGKLVSYDIKAQTHGCIKNISQVLESLNLTLKNLIDITVFLKNMSDFEQYNQIYNQYFNFDNPPTRTTIAVKDLPLENFIEIKAIASLE